MLVGLLDPRPGERWLDVGTGAGGVALRAARAGADVTGLDVAEAALGEARRLAAEEGLDARFDAGDAASLPYADASFDVVASAFGVIFAGSHAAAAAELARVARPGGRLGLTLMPPGSRAAELWTLIRRFGGDEGDHPAAWGEEGRPEELLGGWFELEVRRRESPAEPARDPGEAWAWMRTSFGPVRALVERLSPDEAERFGGEVRALNASYEGQPLSYLVVLGRRR